MGSLLRLFERPPEPAHLDVAHNGETYRVALNRSPRSRQFTLRVRAATRDVLLTMPARASLKAAREFAERHSAWIGVRLKRLPRPVAFEPSARTPLRGVEHLIVHRPGARGVVWLEAGEGEPGSASPAIGRMCRAAWPISSGARRERHRGGGRAPRQGDRGAAEAHRGARHGQPLGLLLLGGAAQLLLAPHPRAALRARLSRRARGGAYGPHEPLAEILEPRPPRHAGCNRAEVWLKAHGASLHRYGAE